MSREGAAEAERRQLAEDRKLVERVDAYGKGLTPTEVGFVQNCLKRIKEEGRVLTGPMRSWLQDIDEWKVR